MKANPLSNETVRPFTLSSKGNGVEKVEGKGDKKKEGHAEGGVEEIEEAEARTPVVAGRLRAPTKSEVDAHFLLHAEYRVWCQHCVAGKAF